MGRPLNTYDDIAIATIVVFSLYLVGAIILCARHGFVKSTGWRFLIILALARLIGSALLLATVNDPTNENLYIGWATLNGLGLGPLVLMLMGLLGRVFDSINRQGHVVVTPLFRHLLEVLMIVGMILLIVGGTESDFTVVDGEPKVVYSGVSRGGTGVFVAVTALLCLEALFAFRNQGYVAQGEHRIIIAIIICLPFVIVRLVYACIVVLGGVLTTKWEYLGMLVIMEMIVVLICEILGFTLDKAPPKPQGDPGMQSQPQPRSRHRRRRHRL
ncbi:Uncharacterized protein TCAP_06283 [Tolypocladium capitatum]|uniref:DUF7702 domain-containing protein n=1 Tax=Tolypocladium capitatum TaxID=45235 RepID=A0A2K3Q882_9HYPO|nr:Uncharacterized protein TCAP_06283 [Tolypocladium capitatum]